MKVIQAICIGLVACPNKNKNCNTEKKITGLKTSLRVTERFAYCLDYLQGMAFRS